jgi:hypothetical protein
VIEGTRHFVVPGDTGCYGAWIGKRSTPHVPWRLNGSLFEVGFNNVHGILEPPAITRKYLLFYCLLGGICGRFADNSGPRVTELRGNAGFLASN